VENKRTEKKNKSHERKICLNASSLNFLLVKKRVAIVPFFGVIKQCMRLAKVFNCSARKKAVKSLRHFIDIQNIWKFVSVHIRKHFSLFIHQHANVKQYKQNSIL
jgi:hypothetical protein